MTQIEKALIKLAAPCTSDDFFSEALMALAEIHQCRWAAFGRLGSKPGMGEIITLCDNNEVAPGFEFELKGSPCEQVYTLTTDDPHITYSDNLAQHFPNFQLIKDLGARSYQAELIFDENGKPFGHVFVLNDAPHAESTDLRKLFKLFAQRIGAEYHRRIIAKQLSEYKGMVSASEHCMSFLDREYQYKAVSKGYETIFLLKNDEIVGKKASEIHGEEVFNNNIKPLLDRCLNGESIHTHHSIHPPHLNEPIYLNVHHSPYFDSSGQVTGVIVSAHDISEIQTAKNEIEFLANHDSLTGLANRRALFHEMGMLLNEQKNEKLQLGIIYLDLDDFKSINDEHGHKSGDLLLIKIAEILNENTDETQMAARMGGDEFIVLSQFPYGKTKAQYNRLLNQLRIKLLNKIKTTMEIGGISLPISASFGLYLVEQPDSDLSNLICLADNEMYKNKRCSKAS